MQNTRIKGTNFFTNLEPKITIQILSNLPTRSIIKCKAVCKRWRDLVESREFAELRLSKPDPNPHLVLYRDSGSDYEIVEFEGKRVIPTTLFKFTLPPPNEPVIGSVNGLVLTLGAGRFSICNPITREYVSLPNPPKYNFSRYHYYSRNKLGFGLTRNGQEYKLVRIVQSECQVYTLGSDRWRSIPVGPPTALAVGAPPMLRYNHTLDSQCATVGGNLYWLDLETGTEVSCFDLEAESFTSFPAPPSRLYHPQPCHRSLSVLDGCLCLCDVSWSGDDVEIDTWLMRGGGGDDGRYWSKEYMIRDGSGRRFGHVFPIKVLEDGGMLLGERNGAVVIEYSKETRRGGCSLLYPKHGGIHEHSCATAVAYTPSFLGLKTLFEEKDVRSF